MSKVLDNLTEQETQYNWAAMFAAYIAGSTLDEIGTTFGCPAPVLRRAATVQDWAAVASRVAVAPKTPSQTMTETRMALLESNRQKNYMLADGLRDRLAHDVDSLRRGTLRIERALVSKGQVIMADSEPTPSDILALANAARTVADMTYRALGDVDADERGNGGGSSTSITVILPTFVSQGPQQPNPPPPAEVIDLRPQEVTVDTIMAKKREAATKALVDGISDGPPQFTP